MSMPKVGNKLRQLRSRRGLGVRELAVRAGISHSTISLIERNRMSPSVDTLAAVLAALGTTISSFFNDLENDIPYSPFYRAEELTEIGRSERISYRLVGMNFPNRQMILLHERYAVGAKTEGSISHAGEEAGIVIKGAVEVTVDGDVMTLQEGDAYYFDSRRPHAFRNAFDGSSEIVSAITPPTY
jgi:transcriptional regulator with XRE-family HTH domain